jgi:hypothetical protein
VITVIFGITANAATLLKLEARVTGEAGKPKIEGDTNLPDGTELIVTIFRKESRFSAGDKITVVGGRYDAGPYSDKGEPLKPGKYTLEVTGPLSAVQPAIVKPLLGENYRNFIGPRVVKGPYGTTLEYRTTFMVAGKVDARTDAAASAQVLREGFEWRRKNCYGTVDSAEKLTGQKATPEQRKRITEKCLAEVDADQRRAAAKAK